MSDKQSTINKAAIAGILALGMTVGGSALAVPDQPKEWEKCAGVSKKGMNDCGSTDGKHRCGGMAERDNADTEWIYVPKGTCEKITGGMVVGMKPAKK